MLRPTTKALVAHLAAPFDAPLPFVRTRDDDARLRTRTWGKPLAHSAMAYACDAALSLGLRCVATVPTATYATTRWAYNKPNGAAGWLVLAPLCGVLGGLGLLVMGLGLDAVRMGLMLSLSCGSATYAMGQRAAGVVQDHWGDAGACADVFGWTRPQGPGPQPSAPCGAARTRG